MRRFMLLAAMGAAVIAAAACRPRPDTRLAAAAAGNDAGEVRRLLAAGHVPDDRGDGLTPLIWAARSGAVEAMTVLLDAGATVDGRDGRSNQWTPLQHAIHRRETDAISLLLERGANPNGSAAPGSLTPLLMAAPDPDPAVVKLLLAYGANPRIGGEGGKTPLTQAVSGGALSDIDRPLFGGCRLATVRALVTHDRTLRVLHNAPGLQAIWWARFHGCEAVLELIGERPTKPGQTIVGVVGIAHEYLRRKPRDVPAPISHKP
jgi:ankyrin repeat protein